MSASPAPQRCSCRAAVCGCVVAVIALVVCFATLETTPSSSALRVLTSAVLRHPATQPRRVALSTLDAEEVACFMRRHEVHHLLSRLPDHSGAALAALSGANLRVLLGADRKLALTVSLLERVRVRGVLATHIEGCPKRTRAVRNNDDGDDARATCEPRSIARSDSLGTWRASPRCLGRAPGAIDPNGYIELLEVREQMNQATHFLREDAFFIAKVLDRTLVEPVVAHARVTRESGDAHTLSLWFDMDAMCDYHRVIDYASFEALRAAHALQSTVVSPRGAAERKPGGVRLLTARDVHAYFRDALVTNPAVLQLTDFWRSGITRAKTSGMNALVFRLQPLHQIEADSVAERCIGRPFVCAQWRTEWVRTSALEDCARSFVAVVSDAREQLSAQLATQRGVAAIDRVKLHLATDLTAGNSDTYAATAIHKDGLRQRALHYAWSALQPESRAAAYLSTIEDSGHRAVVEMMLCGSAELFVTGTRCTTRECSKCSKSNSAFGSRILAIREFAVPPRRSDRRGWNRSTHRTMSPPAHGAAPPPFDEALGAYEPYLQL